MTLIRSSMMPVVLLTTVGCTDLEPIPNLEPVIARFETPTGSLRQLLPDALVTLLGEQKATTQPLDAPSNGTATSVGDSIKLDLPVDGFVRVTRQCDGAPGDSLDHRGTLRADVRIVKHQPVLAFRAQADACRGDFLGLRQLDGTFNLSLATAPWVVAAFDGRSTPITGDGSLDAPNASELVGALRVCVPGTVADPPCSLGDVELSVDVAPDQNIVFVLNVERKLAGIRDAEGLWSCVADTTNPLDSTCTGAGSSVQLQNANQP